MPYAVNVTQMLLPCSGSALQALGRLLIKLVDHSLRHLNDLHHPGITSLRNIPKP